jgi:hypothetical protein
MLHHALGVGVFSARKQLLFCVAACRLQEASIPTEYHAVLNEIESLADSQDRPLLQKQILADWQTQRRIRREETAFSTLLDHVGAHAEEVFNSRARIIAPNEHILEGDPRFEPDDAVMYAATGHPFACCYGDGNGNILRSRSESDLLREILGNPFRPITLDPSCLTPTVKQLAESIYQERAFDRLPVLADALEDAGCNQPDILSHLRGGGEHCRGCWAVDVVLGRD